MAFCCEALRMFAAMSADEVRRITLEIAMLGTKGLSVSDPSARYTLHSLPGEFSGLQLLCYEYVGFKIIDPTVDIGFDIAADYEEACLGSGWRTRQRRPLPGSRNSRWRTRDPMAH